MPVCDAPDLSFATVLAKFERFHQDPVDVFLHVLTTPLIFLGYLALATKAFGTRPMLCVAAAYILTLPFSGMDKAASGVLPATFFIFDMSTTSASSLCRTSSSSTRIRAPA